MKKRDELTQHGCLSKALDDEMLFVLLARDPAAPIAIEAWVQARYKLGLNQPGDPKINEALECAYQMRKQREQGTFT